MDSEWLSGFLLSVKKFFWLSKTNSYDLFLHLARAAGASAVQSAQPSVVKNPPIGMIVGLMSH